MSAEVLKFRCYTLPIIGAITYYLISLKKVNVVFDDWIPNYNTQIFIKGLIILLMIFLACRIIDYISTEAENIPPNT